jgi:HPt (histidine-containing phosphotransfer) domain-containing protein
MMQRRYKERLVSGYFQALNALMSSDDFFKGINEALKILAQATGAGRIYLCEHNTDVETGEIFFKFVNEWKNENCESLIELCDSQRISYSRFSLLNLYEILSSGKIIKYILRDLSAEEQMGFLDLKIKSIIFIPVMIDEEYWGFLGIDDLENYREWNLVEEDILIKFSIKLSSFIKNHTGTSFNREYDLKLKLISEKKFLSIFNTDKKIDINFFEEILSVYINDIPRMGKELEIAFNRKDAAAIEYITHKLTGSLLNLGCESVVEMCNRIEKSAKESLFDENIILLHNQFQKNITLLVEEIVLLKKKYLLGTQPNQL